MSGNKIRTAYRSSKNIYDGVLTQKNPLARAYINFFWGGTDDTAIAQKLLAHIPDDFSGSLLDVPCGTAVFTSEKWRTLTAAKITCLDYSADMLEKARARLGDCKNISLVQGDVGSLPFADESFDIVLSMNGFHAFPDKEKAFAETHRVLKQGGKFLACFYIKGKSKRTDWLVKNVLAKKGWFTPPFFTEDEVQKIFADRYAETEIHTDGAMLMCACGK